MDIYKSAFGNTRNLLNRSFSLHRPPQKRIHQSYGLRLIFVRTSPLKSLKLRFIRSNSDKPVLNMLVVKAPPKSIRYMNHGEFVFDEERQGRICVSYVKLIK